mmetsp:Transcript_87343/g.154851  ORF Transcript_87343/g.154851 Transcript_87343/m.154851 type:complete len:394 (-) Transcript_87343:338-1519(-)|eukprot:CAMPEP_0197643818 /NCGR_PEP_ID=MMETSP1338-20131121/16998_1 /TAXON_ID=43686 ORGANISM="Pelagodinium beii, Strain RCC1491" /NCGR_SAMPLE_ID=MMETSP1338 /ASSEMBLY_ACC=CAM_ASM_000754 /LENGTH=393 /DNA_ID=CAMNT_0043217109 /DNA_START=82 /DNA_END=1263 /DNA_ORIENTATION=-
MAALSDADVEQLLLRMGERVQGEEFKAWQAEFVQAHVMSFEFGVEENRLEHTHIHKSFEAGVESQLMSYLPLGMDLGRLEAALQRPGLIHRLSDDAGRVVEILTQASDFLAFKELMLYEKNKLEEGLIKPEETVLVHDTGSSIFNVEEVLESSARLALAASSDGWTTILENTWIRIDKKPVDPAEPIEIYLRGAWTMDLSFLECCDMMMSFDDRRSSWDQNFRGCDLLHGADLAADDVVVASHIDFGFLLHAAGIPRRLTSRVVRKWGHPEHDSVTTAMIPWNAETNSFDANNPILTQKITTIKPHPSDDTKSVMTTIESNKLGRLPRWVLGSLMQVTAPQIMKGLEQRYIKSIRAFGTSQDILPADFPAPRCYPKPSVPQTAPSCWAGFGGR